MKSIITFKSKSLAVFAVLLFYSFVVKAQVTKQQQIFAIEIASLLNDNFNKEVVKTQLAIKFAKDPGVDSLFDQMGSMGVSRAELINLYISKQLGKDIFNEYAPQIYRYLTAAKAGRLYNERKGNKDFLQKKKRIEDLMKAGSDYLQNDEKEDEIQALPCSNEYKKMFFNIYTLAYRNVLESEQERMMAVSSNMVGYVMGALSDAVDTNDKDKDEFKDILNKAASEAKREEMKRVQTIMQNEYVQKVSLEELKVLNDFVTQSAYRDFVIALGNIKRMHKDGVYMSNSCYEWFSSLKISDVKRLFPEYAKLDSYGIALKRLLDEKGVQPAMEDEGAMTSSFLAIIEELFRQYPDIAGTNSELERNAIIKNTVGDYINNHFIIDMVKTMIPYYKNRKVTEEELNLFREMLSENNK